MVEENKKEPGFWGRTKQVLKVGGAITFTAIAGVVAGPIGAAIAIGVLAYSSHKRNAKNDATKDKGEKENKKPSVWKRALFVVGSIALGALIGGPVGIIAAAALVISDTVSKGKLTEWSGDVLKAPFTLVKEGYSRIREAQELSRKDVKVPEEVKGKKTEKEVMGKNKGGPGSPGGTVGGIDPDLLKRFEKLGGKSENLRQGSSSSKVSDVGQQISPEVQEKAIAAGRDLTGNFSPNEKVTSDKKVIGPATEKFAQGEASQGQSTKIRGK